ncbi:DUF308 domain-containing protein [Nonomuraea basaltis]|uniref:DUF308 domain-containing protein n=1 Tax=Nonomuraea basaltis TaxID=2495887 RepID=UPI00110C41D4|nr:DUF308 domain-containing protein [Nonomuraea basaltis]TMR99468.1 DUF1707 domain-containing protein [Nonomuraea basaltis]
MRLTTGRGPRSAGGRLTLEELQQRLSGVLGARTFGDVEPYVAELPGDAEHQDLDHSKGVRSADITVSNQATSLREYAQDRPIPSPGRSTIVIDDYLGHWWVLTLRGVLALIFGVMAVAWPGITLLVLAIVFGAYAIVDGGLAAVAATRAAKGQRAPLILLAVAGLLFGIMCLIWPGLTVLVVTLLIGIWAIVTGVMDIMAAIRMRREVQGEWLHLVSGALSVLFGALVLIWPATGALTIALIIGIYAILAGIMLIVLSLRVRRHATAV